MTAKRLALWAFLLSPSLVYLVHLDDLARLPQNDYYNVLLELTGGGEHLRADPRVWLTVKSNEHRVTLPALVYAANAALTDGRNLGLALFALACLFAAVPLVWGFLPRELRGPPISWPWLAWGLFLSALVFTPRLAHNVFLGFSGTMWLLANAFTLAAMACLLRARDGAAAGRWMAGVVLFGLLAALTYSSHLSLWPALFVGALLLGGPRWRYLALAAGAAIVYGLYAASYETPSYHPELNTTGFGDLVAFSAAYVGGLFSRFPEVARSYGTVGLVGALGVLPLLLLLPLGGRRRGPLLAPWVMLMVYAAGNIWGTAVARSGFDQPGAPLASRYGSIVAFFWMGLLTSIALLVWYWQPRRRWPRAVALAAVALFAAGVAARMLAHGEWTIARQRDKAAAQKLGEVALVWGIDDVEALESICPWPQQLLKVRDYLEASGHVPFDRPRPPASRPLERDLLGAERDPALRGHFDSLELIEGRLAKVRGWAHLSSAEVAEMVMVDPEGTAHGHLVHGLARGDVAQAVGEDAAYSGWAGYLLLPCGAGEIRPYLRFEGEATFQPLSVSRSMVETFREARDRACG